MIKHLGPVMDVDAWQSPVQKIVLVELAFQADKKGVIRMSQTELSERCGITRRTLATWINAFCETGLVSRDGHGRYRLNIDAWYDLAPLVESSSTNRDDIMKNGLNLRQF